MTMQTTSWLAAARAALDAGDVRNAEILFGRALEEDERNPAALTMLGSLYCQMGAQGLGLALLRMACDNLPPLTSPRDEASCWTNLCAALRRVERLDEAREAARKALACDPANPIALSNLTSAYVNNGTPVQAERWGRKAVAADPAAPAARKNLGIALLEQEKWAEGWDLYESRLDEPGWHRRAFFDRPKWDGRAPGVIAIAGEQGIGDEILFLSCLPDAARAVGRENLLIECQKHLIPLVEANFGVRAFPDEAALLAYAASHGIAIDYWASLGSLPSFYRRSKAAFPAHAGYLRMPEGPLLDDARSWLAAQGPRPYIGLAWRGGTSRTHGKWRNASIKLWQPLMTTGAGTFVSVQYGSSTMADVAHEAKRMGLPHDQERSLDYPRLHALTQACDLVITVCQTAFHTGGANGQPVWCLTPSKPAWRYHLKRDRSLFYPSARLFRQTGDDWTPVFDRVAHSLKQEFPCAR